jgi:hypothetical protein
MDWPGIEPGERVQRLTAWPVAGSLTIEVYNQFLTHREHICFSILYFEFLMFVKEIRTPCPWNPHEAHTVCETYGVDISAGGTCTYHFFYDSHPVVFGPGVA